MKALILNSGMGQRMGAETAHHPKCMTWLDGENTILSRQLEMLKKAGIREVVMTTGYLESELWAYCHKLETGLEFVFVNNPLYDKTNYIYSIYMARKEVMDDILLIHGDLVFSESVIKKMIESPYSGMAVSTTAELPQKDFKAVIKKDADGKNRIEKIGVEFFENAVAAQPFYRLYKKDWMVWLEEIGRFCEDGITGCYAENAFNRISDRCCIRPVDVGMELCHEIDTMEECEKIVWEIK
jgi:phosphoenolpyruvate phosphomutase